MRMGFIISLPIMAALVAGGCSTFGYTDSAAIDEWVWSLVHRPTIQQGNVITQAMLDELETGMSQEQVRFLLGTPALVDVFHPNRWDYLYWLKKPGAEPQNQRLSLYFEEGVLMRIEGQYTPGVEGEAQNLEEVLVEVPDNSGSDGIITRTLEAIGVDKDQ